MLVRMRGEKSKPKSNYDYKLRLENGFN